MGASKAKLFDTKLNHAAVLAKALAHPARIAIINELARLNSCICGDLVDQLPLSQATVSQHLKELKNVGLITGDIDGQKVCYCLNYSKLEEIKDVFTNLIDSALVQKDCC